MGKNISRTRGASVAIVLLSALASQSAAQAPEKTLAVWYDADGFYNRPGVTTARAEADFTVCRAEALRLKEARRQGGGRVSGPAFGADGSYNPVVSGAAVGIFNLVTSIQNVGYNASIESTEFRDCAVSLGYRRFTLGMPDREKFDATPDRGFAALVSAQTPEGGKESSAKRNDNYYDATLAAPPYTNSAPDASVAAELTPPAEGEIAQIAAGATAASASGSAIVVLSARMTSSQTAVGTPNGITFRRVTVDGQFLDLLKTDKRFTVQWFGFNAPKKDPTFKGKVGAPRYSTFQIPAGRYALSYLANVNACLGTVTFEAKAGDVLYLGDLVFKPAGLPMGTLFMPFGNINKGIDNNIKDDVGIGIGDALDAARAALKADDAAKASLKRVAYQNGYHIPCDGEYIGRVWNEGWSMWDAGQGDRFNDAMAAKLTEAAAR